MWSDAQVNDCLYPGTVAESMTPASGAAAPSALTLRFATFFDQDEDLRLLTPAARRVLAVAAALFFRSGALTVSVRQLTKACGLSPGALYNHFQSRDDLLFVLVHNGHVRTERKLARALDGVDGDPRQGLDRFVRAYVEVHVSFPEYAQLVHREYVHLDDPRRAEIVEIRRRMRDRLVTIVRDGEEHGAFHLLGGRDAAVSHATMILDMCGRTSEWFNPAQHSPELADRYVAAALRVVGARF